MKVVALFEANGKLHALFHPSTHPDAPRLNFRCAKGQRTELLEVPVELESLTPSQLHAAIYVDLSSGAPVLARRIE